MGLIVTGTCWSSVDATLARIMAFDSGEDRVPSSGATPSGPIRETAIEQRGESWESAHSPFQILDRLHLREMQAMWDVT